MFQVLTPEPADYVIDSSSERFTKQLILSAICILFIAIIFAPIVILFIAILFAPIVIYVLKSQ